jgi:hypothetical protein
VKITIQSTGQKVTLPDDATSADIDEAVELAISHYKKSPPTPTTPPPQIPKDPKKATAWDTIVETARNTGKAIVGMAENAANQASMLGSYTALSIPAFAGAVGAEAAESVVNQRMPSFSGVTEKFHSNMAATIYQPMTQSGKRQVAATADVLTAIPKAVDAVDDMTGQNLKKNYPNAYAATQVAGEFAPMVVVGKAMHSGYSEAHQVLDTMPKAKEAPLPKDVQDIHDILVEQGVNPKEAKSFAEKAATADTSDPKIAEIVTEQLDKVVEETRKAEPVEPKAAPKGPEFVSHEFTPEERTQLVYEIDRLIREDGPEGEGVREFPTEIPESLINLTRVEGTERQLAVHQKIGEMVREKVKERLGEDSGKLEDIMGRVNEAIIQANSKDTGIDFLKTADKASLDLSRIAVESQLVRQTAAKYVKMVDAAAEKANKTDATEADVLLYMHYKDMAAQYVALDAEIARQQAWALNARKIDATGEGVNLKELTTADLENNPALMDSLKADLEKAGGLKAFKEMANEHLKAADLQQKVAQVKRGVEPSFLNVLTETRGFSLLSSLYGRTRDTIHNILRPLSDNIEHTMAAGISKLRGREAAEATTFKEAAMRWVGDWQGTLEAASKVSQTAKSLPTPELRRFFRSPVDTLYQTIEHYEKFVDDRGFLHGKSKAVLEGVGRKYVRSEYIRQTAPGKAADTFLKGIGKLIHAEDSVRDATWKLVDLYGTTMRSLVYGTIKYVDLPSEYMGYNSEVYGLAAREAVKRGLEGEKFNNFVADIIMRTRALRDDIKLPDSATRSDRALVKQIHEAGMKRSLDRTLKNEFEGEAVKAVEGLVNHSAAGKILKLGVNQFFSTTARLVQFEMQRNIATTWMSKTMRDSLMGRRGAQAQDLATAKVLFGSMAHSVAIALVTEGILVGYAPSNQRKEFRDAGMLEYALNINGKLYQINQADPYGGFLSSVAAALYTAESTKNDTTANRAQAMFGAMLNDRLSRSWMKSLFDLKSAVDDKTGAGWNKYLMNFGTTFLPASGFISSTRDMFGNGEVRAAETFGERVAKLYHPESLDIAPDQYGKDRHTEDRFMGVRKSEPKLNSARMEIVKHGIKLPDAPQVLSLIPGSPYGHTLEPADQRKYMRSLADEPIKMEERLQEIVDSPAYKEQSAEVQKMMLQKMVEMSHQMAKALLFKDEAVLQSAKNKAEAIGELYTNHTDTTWKGNWFQFLTGEKAVEREIMNRHGLKAKEK